MNNGYIKIYFFVLILFVYVNDKILTTEYATGNLASPEQTRVKIILSEIDSTEESLSETTLTNGPRRKKVRYTKTRPQNIPSESSSSESLLFRTPRPKKIRSKKTSSKATLSKTPPSKTILPETGLPEAGSSETTLPEIALPQAVLTNPPSSRIAYTPALFKLDSIYKKNKHLLCTKPAETRKAIEVMNEAVMLLQYHATTKSGYKHHCTTHEGINMYYRNNGNNSYTEKCKIQISNPNKYDDIIYMLWDPNGPLKFDPSFIHGKIIRSYNRNLLMVEKFYKNSMLSSKRYFYALAKKAHISEDTTIIVMASGNINDHNPFSKKIFKNEILESINSFNTSVDFDEDVKNGYYKKTFVNLSGYLIRKKNDHVDVTFVNSINFNALIPLKFFVKNANIEAMHSIISLKYYFDNE
ncbi:fam-a protein [Plasmodium vinckei brucechwatti]|uniref:Fam-a protein n=1 Tax=Plasmodium vinckei brucechwatti TaxID=119398 RepID=A0A6V7RW08_PLAVN|nr:fam-a protein [Plasmodium vinckei brucechwatti]